MNAKVENIVNNFKEKITIFQALCEAVSNSLEANATKIQIIFHSVDSLDGVKKYDSFSVIDDGDGFNKENIDSFLEYLSSYKQKKYGCKGIGRFTWLKVFALVKIHSEFKTGTTDINFNLQFDETNRKDLAFLPINREGENKTRIDFLNCKLTQNEYLSNSLSDIWQDLLNTFAIKLFLINKENKTFKISITDDDESEEYFITNDDLLALTDTTFSINNGHNEYEFKLYYAFFKDGKKRKQIVLCADKRGIVDINSKGKIISNIPNGDSLICLIKSNYLDNTVNDSRTGFTFNNDDEELFGLSQKQIEIEIKKQIESIVVDAYPSIVDDNKRVISECIEMYPYLKKYILEDDSIITDRNKLITKSNERYEKEKSETIAKVTEMMSLPEIDEKILMDGIIDLNIFSSKELAKYFLYRQKIIDCLGIYIKRNEPVEKLLHDLFIPQGEVLTNSLEDRLKNNIWLLDDKFMSCEYAFSDIKVSKIRQIIKEEELREGIDDGVEPDLSIFYSNKTAVVVEFKALGADYNKKLDSISEIDRNNGIIAANIDDINSIYSFIITDFDNVFLNRMGMQHGIKRMFDNNNEQMFYFYNENVKNAKKDSIPCHTFIISAKSIYSDANARNKLFIDIIKNSN